MILLDGTELEADGELIPGRRINRYPDRDSIFRKPMAEVEVGDILWDELSCQHWVTDEVRYTANQQGGDRGASLSISDGPKGRMFYENEDYYSYIFVLNDPSVLLSKRMESLQKEHALLLEAEKPRNAFHYFSADLRVGDTFLHPTRGWLTVKSLIADPTGKLRGTTSRREFSLTDGTQTSTEELGRQTQILRIPDQPDMRDASISDKDFNGLLGERGTKPRISPAVLSSRMLAEGGTPYTLNGAPGRSVRIFFDELEKDDIVFWPGAGWQTVIGLVASEATAEKGREVKVATLSNRERVFPTTLETIVVEIFVPDGEVPPSDEEVEPRLFHELALGDAVLYQDSWRKIVSLVTAREGIVRGTRRVEKMVLEGDLKVDENNLGTIVQVRREMSDRAAAKPSYSSHGPIRLVEPQQLEIGDEVFTKQGHWITLRSKPLADRGTEGRWFILDGKGKDRKSHTLHTQKESYSGDRWVAQTRRGPESAVFVWKSPHAVAAGERVLTEDGWVRVMDRSEGPVDYDGRQWRCYSLEDCLMYQVREFRDENSNALVYAQVPPEEAAFNAVDQTAAVYKWRPLSSVDVAPGDEAKTPISHWLPLHSVALIESKRAFGKLKHTGFEGTFRHLDGSFAHGPLTTFTDIHGKLSYMTRRKLSEDEIKELQKGAVA